MIFSLWLHFRVNDSSRPLDSLSLFCLLKFIKFSWQRSFVFFDSAHGYILLRRLVLPGPHNFQHFAFEAGPSPRCSSPQMALDVEAVTLLELFFLSMVHTHPLEFGFLRSTQAPNLPPFTAAHGLGVAKTVL